MQFFKEEHDVLVHDPSGEAKTGDMVLVRRLDKEHAPDVNFAVDKIISRDGSERRKHHAGDFFVCSLALISNSDEHS